MTSSAKNLLPESALSPIPELLAEMSAGKMVILVDDADRENEGDLTLATDCVTSEHIEFMLEHGRGLICVSVAEQKAKQLGLDFQVKENNSSFRTPFSFSIDHKDVALAGLSASSRAFTLKRLVAPGASPNEFVSPGNIFPLVANVHGVLGRKGQTEGSCDLARLSGCSASGIICEILDEHGRLRRGEDLARFASHHNLLIGSVEDLINYRLRHEVFVRQVGVSQQQTDYGSCQVVVFEDDVSHKEHLALIFGDVTRNLDSGVLCRIHSECLTGDVLGSERCDCGGQLERAIGMIQSSGAGVVLYLRQEGRGIGLLNKLRAYELQDQGADTVDANLKLGFGVDERDFRVAAQMLKSLNISSIRLITNNPQKAETMAGCGIKVEERVPVLVNPSQHNLRYLHTKASRLGHTL